MKRRLGLIELESRLVPATPVLVRDILPGTAGSIPNNTLAVGSQLYFAADDGVNNTELWISDGTSAGTKLVSNIEISGGSYPQQLTEVNGLVFFSAQSIGDRELWVSDGTSAGTRLVRNILDFGSSNPDSLTNVNGTLFFYATSNNGGPDRELWKSDGTSSGTVRILDINPTGSSVGSSRGVNVGGIFYFPANDDTLALNSGTELWRSDGTSTGTFQVRDILPGSYGSNPIELAAANGKLFFSANDGGSSSGRELWVSDGTSTGTIQLKDIFSGTFGSYPYGFTNVGGTVFFSADGGSTGRELWKTDGTAGGTVLVANIRPESSEPYSSFPYNFANIGGVLFFSADDNVNGRELWKSDGTSAGTVRVSDINPGMFSSNPSEITNVAGVAYFSANGGGGYELWRSDGVQTTLIDVEPTTVSFPSSLTAIGNQLYFKAFRSDVGGELFKLTEDAIPPTIINIDSPDPDTSYYTGQSLTVTIQFSEPVTLTGGNLLVTLDTGAVLTFAPFSGTTASALYTVSAGETSTDLNVTGLSLDIMAFLQDASGNNADLTLPQQNLAVTSDLMINLPPLAPTISDIPNQFVAAGTTIGPLTFTVADVDSTAVPLTLSVTSDNPGLIPASAVTFGGSGSSRTITINTLPGVTGVTTLTVTVTDPDGLTATDTIVVSQNGPPTISVIPNQNVTAGDTVGPLPFTVGGNLSNPATLVLSAASDNAAIPVSAITFGGNGANRTITVNTPAGIATTTTITITVTDPSTGFTANQSFLITQALPNTPPTISDIPDQNVTAGTTVGPLNFTVGDAETPSALVVSVTSNNPALIPANSVVLSGTGNQRTITFPTTAGVSGVTTLTVTVRDSGGLTATDTIVVTQTPPPASPFAIGSGPGNAAVLRVFNPDLTERFNFQPFGGYDCGIRVAMADFNGDGVDDIVAGTRFHDEPGWPMPSRVVIFDGVNRAPLFDMEPFGAGFSNGVFVSAGDITGDGRAELAITADYGGGARVRVFTPGSTGFTQMADFVALQDAFGNPDTSFRGGARSAIGDFNNDGRGDLVFAVGFGGGPRVAIFDGASLGMNGGPKLCGDFFAFESNLRNGVNISVGDVDGDGFADLAAVPALGGPRVKIFSGAALLKNQTTPFVDFFAGNLASRNGLRVAVKNLDGDPYADVIIGTGPNDGHNTAIGYRGKDLINPGAVTPSFSLDAFPDPSVGIWVG